MTENGEEEECPKILKVRVAQCRMPYRWAEPLPSFNSCLASTQQKHEGLMSPGTAGQAAIYNGVLRGAMSGDDVGDESWLTSTFLDLVFAKFARAYQGVHFMPIEFAAFRLPNMHSKADMSNCTDILGRTIDLSMKKPIIFMANIQNLHWNLLRVQHYPVPELQLFEPMGHPKKRAKGAHSTDGVSFRYIPKSVFQWLDTMWGKCNGESWAQRSYSAITDQQQETGFDCGVASLLYAEKCGQEWMREDIDMWTSQDDITEFRLLLQKFLQSESK